jgi:hypothetical protein
MECDILKFNTAGLDLVAKNPVEQSGTSVKDDRNTMDE